MSGIGEKAGGAVFSQTKVLAEAVVPLLSSPWAGAGRYHISVSINQVHMVRPTLLTPPNFGALSKAISSGFSIQATFLGSYFRLSLNFSNKQHLALACSVRLAKWPQAWH